MVGTKLLWNQELIVGVRDYIFHCQRLSTHGYRST